MTDDHATAVLAYHQRTKHRLERYAAGPETLDWDAQPDPFRRFAGAPLLTLPLPADSEKAAWTQIFSPGAIAPHAASLESLGLLLELSFALSAWKEFGPDRWAQRCNPSSGNLHPTEVYLLTRGLAGVSDALYHYAPKEHALEQRATLAPLPNLDAPRLLVGFSSIQWREAWKYGERAFRYCQLDMGHAIGALRYAAAVLGWRLREVALTHAEVASLLGLDRSEDFAHAEREEPEAVFELLLTPDVPEQPEAADGAVLARWLAGAAWCGQANRLDAHPMYRWPVMDEVAQASRRTERPHAAPMPALAARRLLPATEATAAHLIRTRRSAQRFERRARLDAEQLWPLLAALMPSPGNGQAVIPWDIGQTGAAPAVHAVLFAHRVDGLTPGAYLLPRAASALPALQAVLPHLSLRPADGAPPDVPLYEMAANPALAGTLRTLSCHQAIAADAVFVVALLAEFHEPLQAAPWRYRELLQEAGQIGQTLYLEAEAAGLRGTGIGCYFDDPMHALLGLNGLLPDSWQVLYHFSVGLPVPDTRITSSPPYKEDRP